MIVFSEFGRFFGCVLCHQSLHPELLLVAQIEALINIELAVTNDMLGVIGPIFSFDRLFFFGNLFLTGLSLVLGREFPVLIRFIGLSISLPLTLLWRIGSV